MKKLVFGIGINDNKYPAEIDRKPVREYSLWHSMLARCYSETYLKYKPTYRGCTVCENFKSYSYFYEWVNRQVGGSDSGFHLDKDILFKGNKLYSEDTCVFVPIELNGLMTKHQAARGEYPLGVSYNKQWSKFKATVYKNGKNHFLGYFTDPIAAFSAYKLAKEDHIKSVALKYKGLVDHRVYAALLNYKVEITD